MVCGSWGSHCCRFRQVRLPLSWLICSGCPAGLVVLFTCRSSPPFLQVPDGLWDALACMRSLVELQITVHATDETTTISSHAWRCLAACTQLSCLRLLDGSVCGGIDEEGKRPWGNPAALHLFDLSARYVPGPQTVRCACMHLGTSLLLSYWQSHSLQHLPHYLQVSLSCLRASHSSLHCAILHCTATLPAWEICGSTRA